MANETTERDFPRELRDGADWLVTMGVGSQVAECARSAADELDRLHARVVELEANERASQEISSALGVMQRIHSREH